MNMSHYACSRHRTTCGNFFPLTVWVLGVDLRLSGTPDSLSHLASPFLFWGGQFSYVTLVSLKFNM